MASRLIGMENLSHIDYVIESLTEINQNKQDLKGMKITWQPPQLRHFTAKFDYL
jgi:tryptophanase